MGIGMVFIVDQKSSNIISTALNKMTPVHKIGEVVEGSNSTNYV